MILVLDNRDSFVHNLARYVRLAGGPTQVIRSDKISVAEVAELQPSAIVISPGPGGPADAGCSIDVVQRLGEAIPILGVCLGCQAIAQAFGATVERAPQPMHGRTSSIEHNGTGLFHGIESPLTVCRYHSLAVSEPTLPAEIRCTARDDQGVIMAIEHRRLPIYGVQFHPEAILTDQGHRLIGNFLTEISAEPR